MATTYKPKGTSRGTIFFGVGHGGADPGAVGYIREEDFNLTAALAAKDYAVGQGFTVVMSRIKDENDPVTEEVKEANASGALCAVGFHANAGKGDGFECYYGIGSGSKGSKALAQAIEKEVKAIGQNSRGCKTKAGANGKDYFAFIRDVQCVAVITEGCFVDTKKDAQQFDTAKEQKAYGVAVAKGTINYLEVTGRVAKVDKPAAKPAPAKKAETCKIELPVLEKGSKGASVKAMQTLIIAAGYSCGSAEADGKFGAGTERGLEKYQKKKGLKVDGICGAKTWAALLK